MKGILILSSNWDSRFLSVATTIASWSKDPSAKIGAIAVKDRTVIAQGYNGFPRNIKDNINRYNDRAIKYKYIVHAEMNCIYNAANNGVSLRNSTVYVIGLPVCHECAKGLIQVGVTRVVSPLQVIPDHWKDSSDLTKELFKEAGVVWDWIKF